uniref:dCTP pyrophosphatase 1 n=1 Tax=Globisporangium ultimum (strain ATCC 200006 / CBS 805.95 / DAOM BR144) TaxID=431595 RepID=K3X2S4_GLOUD
MDLKPLEMKGGVDALDESDDERHANLADIHPAVSSSASVALGGEGEGHDDGLDGGSSAALFDEYYDDWAAFDHAVAVAIDKHHPIRKRSSLTFEVYNRTVSKGRHDRKNIAEFLSKTFKCTHGIKFRARGNGRRLRHKLRDIGCPFHVYASAVEFGATYRVKVRMQDKHNHPIGPDTIKNMPALHDSDYELGSESEAAPSISGSEMQAAASAAALTTSAEMDLQVQFVQAQAAAQAHAHAQNQAQAQAHAHAMAQAQAQAHAHAQSQALAQAQAQVLLKAQTQAVEQAHAQVQEMLNAQAQAQALAQAQAQVQARAQAQAHALLQAAHEHETDILDAAGVHESEALLASAIESSMGDEDDFAHAQKELHSPARFEETTTLESIRKKLAHFADQRDWNQFHTPRNLLLAMTGEVGELCEIFQWKNENKPIEEWTPEEKTHLGEELSDVLIYLVRLADKCSVDLPTAVHDKIAKNARKYPAELVKGSSKKYNEYKRQRVDHDSGNDGGQHDDGTSNGSNTNESTL